MKYLLFIIFFILLNSVECTAQVKLLLLNGEQISTDWLKYEKSDSLFYYKNAKGRMRSVESEFIFSIKEPNDTEKILYRPDSILKYSPQEMRCLIAGQLQAKRKYKPYFSMLIGASMGIVGIMLPYRAGLSMFYSTLIPLSISQTILFLPLSSKKIPIENQLQYPEIYKKGFRLRARRKRFVLNLIGTLVGIGVSYTLYSSQFK